MKFITVRASTLNLVLVHKYLTVVSFPTTPACVRCFLSFESLRHLLITDTKYEMDNLTGVLKMVKNDQTIAGHCRGSLDLHVKHSRRTDQLSTIKILVHESPSHCRTVTFTQRTPKKSAI